ncbi:MAG: RiPP maturation radical SAM C-methyltransferase [Anaerovibrio sp.]|nr:RiPP maturation radical SAM C-methyltransferase [Anaerovibrio sp.]
MIDVCLVEVPYSSFASPVFSLSLLKGALHGSGLESQVVYGNMLFCRKVGLDHYLYGLSMTPQELMFGDMVFAAYAQGKPLNKSQLIPLLQQQGYGERGARAIYEEIEYQASQVAIFIQELGEMILSKKPRIVAMANMFFQTNACLALARYLKEKRPELCLVLGGANCIGSAGWALVRDFPQLDVVFSGEADSCFAKLCHELINKGITGQLPYGALTREMALPANLAYDAYPVAQTANMDTIPYPDYDDYFAALEEYGYGQEVNMSLFTEFSRGCWWNAVKGCTFCGLNPLNNGYRTKSKERILAELDYLSHRYHSKRFQLTDNILGKEHLAQLLPLLAKEQKGYVFFGEIKSNINRQQLKLLRQAGFYFVQPGIESLQDDLLSLMNKGNRGIRHVELLKNAKETGVGLIWHLLHGFPGETAASYKETAKIVKKIGHLLPPQQCSPLMFVRYSYYWQNPEKYNLQLVPVLGYAVAFPEHHDYIRDAAFMFHHQSGGSNSDYAVAQKKLAPVIKELAESVAQWHQDYINRRPQRFEYTLQDNVLELLDLRQGAKHFLQKLVGVKKDICLAADRVITRARLLEDVGESSDREAVVKALEELIEDNVILAMGQELLFLAVDSQATVPLDFESRGIGSYKSLSRYT